MMRDRIIYGAVAGITGAICQNLYAMLTRVLGYQGPFYIDYGKILLFYGMRRGWLPDLLGLIAHFVWDIIIAILFAYMIKHTSVRYLPFKGLIYGVGIWFAIKTGATLFKIPVITGVEPVTVGVFLIGSILFGLVIAYSLKWLDRAVTE